MIPNWLTLVELIAEFSNLVPVSCTDSGDFVGLRVQLPVLGSLDDDATGELYEGSDLSRCGVGLRLGGPQCGRVEEDHCRAREP